MVSKQVFIQMEFNFCQTKNLCLKILVQRNVESEKLGLKQILAKKILLGKNVVQNNVRSKKSLGQKFVGAKCFGQSYFHVQKN